MEEQINVGKIDIFIQRMEDVEFYVLKIRKSRNFSSF